LYTSYKKKSGKFLKRVDIGRVSKASKSWRLYRGAKITGTPPRAGGCSSLPEEVLLTACSELRKVLFLGL